MSSRKGWIAVVAIVLAAVWSGAALYEQLDVGELTIAGTKLTATAAQLNSLASGTVSGNVTITGTGTVGGGLTVAGSQTNSGTLTANGTTTLAGKFVLAPTALSGLTTSFYVNVSSPLYYLSSAALTTCSLMKATSPGTMVTLVNTGAAQIVFLDTTTIGGAAPMFLVEERTASNTACIQLVSNGTGAWHEVSFAGPGG